MATDKAPKAKTPAKKRKKTPKIPRPAGRPLKFETVAVLQKKIDEYFANCDPHWVEIMEWVQRRENSRPVYDEDGQPVLVLKKVKQKTKQIPYTITGLAMALGTTRETLLDYEEKYDSIDPGFSDTIKSAKVKCQNFAELSLFGSNATGPIFNLKNNYKWKDRTEVEGTGEQKLIIETRKHNASNKD